MAKLSQVSCQSLVYTAFYEKNQIEEFIAYHEKVKQFLNLMDELESQAIEPGAANPIEQLAKKHPEIGNFLLANAFDILDKDKRRRLWLGAHQIENIINRDLEKSISRRKGGGNIIRRDL